MAAAGPESWQRIEPGETPAAIPVEPVTVFDIEADESSITFEVDQVGSPVLVKASYHPNWEVSGAEGPYRVTPNEMVVVPTSTRVELTYGRSPVELGSSALTLVGIVLLVLLFRARPVVMPEDRGWRRSSVDPVFGAEGGGGPRHLVDDDATADAGDQPEVQQTGSGVLGAFVAPDEEPPPGKPPDEHDAGPDTTTGTPGRAAPDVESGTEVDSGAGVDAADFDPLAVILPPELAGADPTEPSRSEDRGNQGDEPDGAGGPPA